MSKSFLLPAYVCVESVRALVIFSAVQSHIPISSSQIVFLAELAKLVVALIFLAKSNGFQLSTAGRELLFSPELKRYMAISVPAILYLFNTLLYMFALKLTTPSFLHVAILAKLPITAILHHFLVRPQHSANAWTSLVFLTFGLFLFNLPSDFLAIVTGSPRSGVEETGTYSSFAGPIIGLLVAVVSGLASTYTEVILKQNIPFWVAQTWLYAFGSFASAVVFLWNGRGQTTTFVPETLAGVALHISVVVTVAATGLTVANILRQRDNLVKIVGTSASIVIIIVAQVALFPHLRATTITMQTMAGLGIISISTWTYSYYQQPQEASIWKGEKAQQLSNLLVPSRRKILLLGAVVAQLTLITGLVSTRGYSNFFKNQRNSQHHAPTNDIARFFEPHNITPTDWAPGVNPPRCAWDYIVKNKVTTLSTEILNWEEAYLNSSCPVFPVPDTGLIFHIYWSGRWRPFNDMAIEAFLATQRLRDGHRLIYWYSNGGPPDSTRERFRPYSDYVEFREADMFAESQGTCLMQMQEWTNASYRESVGMLTETLSDIIRTLLLAKYGGVWLDADIVLLRDITPLIRMGPATVGLPDGGYNNALLIYGPQYGGVGEKVLDVVCRIPFDPTEFFERWPGHHPGDWNWMYNSGLSGICEHSEGCGIGLVPAGWTDGWCWLDEGQEIVEPCGEEGKFGEGSFPPKFRGLFSFHTRLDHDDSCIADGATTTSAKLRKLIQNVLAEGLKLDGRDVFPPSSWYDY